MNPLTRLEERLDRLGNDERAVSPVIGFVLMFALIMIVFTLYQTNVVPAQNAEVEFQHSQTVETQMSQLSSAIQSASADGTSRSQTIATGMNYPSRALFINPGSPSGSLKTGNEHTISLKHVNVEGSEYWTDTASNDFDTKSLSYHVNYNVKQQDPEFEIDSGVVTKSYGSGSSRTVLPVGDSAAVVPGEEARIDLTFIGGTYQKSGSIANPTVKPISTSTRHLKFEGDDSEIQLDSSLTTSQCTAKWSGLLGADYDSMSGEYPNSAIDCSSHVMNLKDGVTYDLRLSLIGFGDTSGLSADAHEVVPTEETTGSDEARAELSATVGEETSFTVLVRDKYGNPVSGAKVNVPSESGVDSSAKFIKPARTNDQGEATFRYTPASTGSKTIEVSSPDASFEATYEIRVNERSPGRSGSSTGFAPGDLTNGYDVGVIIKSASQDSIRFENIGSKDVTATDVRLSGYFQGPGTNPSVPNKILYSNTDVKLNGDLTSLGSNEYSISSGNTHQVDLGNTGAQKGGFMILTVKYEYTQDGETKTTAATYAVTIGQSDDSIGNNGNGNGNKCKKNKNKC